TIIENEKQFQIHIFKGQRYDTKTIVVGKKEQLLLQEAKLTSFIKEDNISIQQYPDLANKVVSYYENRGFPFSQVFLDSITIQNGQIEAKLKIERNQFILFDSIILKGNAKLSYSYLYPYLGLRKNKPYDEKVIRKIPQRMQELPFVTQALPAGIEFINDKAYLYVYLDKQRVNQFDGIIALVPVDEQSGKVALSGELNLGLKNVFTLGESISLEWRSPNRFSQYLNIKANFPYLFRTPFGVDGAFLLDKTDTSYLSINYPIGLQYSFNGNNYIKTYLDLSSSRILNKELLVITPDDITYADFNKQLYGIELMIRQLDYIYNPRKGFTLVINGAAGKIKIKQNHAVDPEVYDGVEMERTRYRLLGDVKGYIPLGKRFVLHVNAHFGTIVGENNLENELFKIGGFKTLRGFDEHSILASTYAVGLAEARYLFAKNSYIHLFYNMAGYEHSTTISYVKDYPIGFGAGVAFQTKAGLFNLIYALGRQFDNPISFKSGKIHFGIVLNF
ncbi:BamA/TamA family outer membrane protein, partial [Bacteroidales bacterium OttesenSCG-928-A14]|nr:BamA/TamA family outer membrane protein [Bacteroidales bacterium OttesenSCG-928-A14]